MGQIKRARSWKRNAWMASQGAALVIALTVLARAATAADFYVDQPADYLVTMNNAGGAGPDNTDIVSWRPATPEQVTNLVFGTTAFGSIQDAVNAASAGTIIHVAPGTFVENVRVNDSVTIVGAGSAQTFIDGGGGPGVDHHAVFRLGSPTLLLTVAISNVTIQNGSRCGSGIAGGGIRSGRSSTS